MEKTRYDERQESQLLRIESKGGAFAWWGLLAVILGQWVVFGSDFSRLAGELAVFLPLSVYLGVSSLLSGLRDRYWPATVRGKLLLALLFGLSAGGLNALAIALHSQRAWGRPLPMFLTLLISVFAFAFLALLCLEALWRRRRKALDEEREEE